MQRTAIELCQLPEKHRVLAIDNRQCVKSVMLVQRHPGQGMSRTASRQSYLCLLCYLGRGRHQLQGPASLTAAAGWPWTVGRVSPHATTAYGTASDPRPLGPWKALQTHAHNDAFFPPYPALAATVQLCLVAQTTTRSQLPVQNCHHLAKHPEHLAAPWYLCCAISTPMDAGKQRSCAADACQQAHDSAQPPFPLHISTTEPQEVCAHST